MTKRSAKLEEKLQNLPTQPGVYLHKNEQGTVIYVGKAKNLRSRVRSYFQDPTNLDPKTRRLVPQIDDLETIIVDSEVEALILEANLIKEHHPRYNVVLRDDKSYPYIRITREPFPRVFVTRKIIKDGSKYLGPYTDVKHLRHIIKSIGKIFPIRTCRFFLNDEVIAAKKVKLCLEYHIKRCLGPCEGLQSQQDYQAMILQVEKFLKGKTRDLIRELQSRMEKEAAEMHFEEAARLRDQIQMISDYNFLPRKVQLNDMEDRDVVAMATEDDDACMVVFKIRDGKVIGRQHYYLKGAGETEPADILTDFLQQFYLSEDYLPKQILLPSDIGEEKEVMESWLGKTADHRVELFVPQKGDKKKLLDLCQKNAKFLLGELMIQKLKAKDKVPYRVEELQKNLNMEKPPLRIEGFDISNIQGTDAVASMVCFMNGLPRKSEYRIFKIRSKDTPDDFAMMHEAVWRRYRRRLDENQPLPDLILIDGGKGQLNSAVQALQELGIENQPIVGLAKRMEDVFVPGNSDPMNIPKRSGAIKLLQQVRDEAHRFAVGHFRKQHKKRLLHSPLDDIAGVGPSRKTHLLKTFGSLKKIRTATLEELQTRGKLSQKVAEAVIDALGKT
ncbi:MAG: excinuclease ABC subunit UvrC [Calditrichia bacterium]